MIADSEFRVWSIRECAAMIRGQEHLRGASLHEIATWLEGFADELELSYILDVTTGDRDNLGRPIEPTGSESG